MFDRFAEELDDVRVVEPYRMHNGSLLLESIQKELSDLLNTRLPPRRPPAVAWQPTSEPQTVLDYGVPAFSSLSSGRFVDVQLLQEAILAKIRSFEPRLEDLSLDLHADPEDPAAMLGILRGMIRLGSIRQPVCFPVSLRDHGEEATISLPEPE
ncbi:MAG: type VI secretion system baseplate subunit TssE [Silvibacterium sp.]